MPRLDHRMIINKNKDELKKLIEILLLHVSKIGGINNVDKLYSPILSNVFSYYRKIDEMTQEEINILWETVASLSQKFLKKKAMDVIDSLESEERAKKGKFLYGRYWIFPGKSPKYIKCDDHIEFANKNSDTFKDGLGVDSYDLLHATTSGLFNIIPLVLSAGAIMANFVMEGKIKVGRFQLAQVSLPWLKKELNKMPIYRSHVRIVDPIEKYEGPQSGIYFSFRRAIKDKV